MKRKSSSKEEPEPKRLQRSARSAKPNEGVFAALCSTLSQAVLPSKKAAGGVTEAPRSDTNRKPDVSSPEEKGLRGQSDVDGKVDDHSEKEAGSSPKVSDELHDSPKNGASGDDRSLVPPQKSSPEMAVNGS